MNGCKGWVQRKEGERDGGGVTLLGGEGKLEVDLQYFEE